MSEKPDTGQATTAGATAPAARLIPDSDLLRALDGLPQFNGATINGACRAHPVALAVVAVGARLIASLERIGDALAVIATAQTSSVELAEAAVLRQEQEPRPTQQDRYVLDAALRAGSRIATAPSAPATAPTGPVGGAQ